MIHLIHGFNETHPLGKPSVAALRPYIEELGHEVHVWDYGNLDLVAVRNNDDIARMVWGWIRKGDTIVGFSNGAAIAARVAELGAPVEHLVFIQPALKRSWAAPTHVRSVTIYYNSGDLATVGAKWWRRATNIWRWKNKHRWGEMGHEGFSGSDYRVTQYDTLKNPDMPPVSGHTGWKNSSEWLRFIAEGIV